MMIWSTPDTDGKAVVVNIPNRIALVSDIRNCLRAGRGFSVATLNLDHVTKLSSDHIFRDAYTSHTHVTADGNPIVWLSRLAGQNIALVPGSELIDPVATLAAEENVSVALVGSSDSSLTLAKSELEKRHPGLNVALTLSPPMGFDPAGKQGDDVIAAIAESGARVVFLALGAPKQEVFAARAQAILSDVGFLSIGAGIDFISGNQRRAPKWVRAIAAEWLWRLAINPQRLAARYALCFRALPGLTWRAIGYRRRGDAIS